jgi:alpha-galactosidase
VVFSRNITNDILSYPEFKNVELTYMDIDPVRLKVGAQLCRQAAALHGATPKIRATMDRREALKGADFVINMVQIGGATSTIVDFEIPRKYGLNFTVADTTGPGGLFRALRTFPMLQGLCQDMTEICPSAYLINYSNPMSMNMQTVYRTSSVKGVGLCHSVQGTFQELCGYLKEDHTQCSFICAGINHMAFFTRLEKNGVDLYPRLFEAMKDPVIRGSNFVRFELMKRLGYFPTESSGHHAEYSPYFIPHGPDTIGEFAIPVDAYLRTVGNTLAEFEKMREQSRQPIVKKAPGGPAHRSVEYGSTIIHSVATGQPSVVYGNMPNHGAISNIVETAIVEAPTLVDRTGLKFAYVGDLPPQVVGYVQPHVTQHELFIRAAIEGRRDYVYQCAMFDPLTAASMRPDDIVAMCDELIAAHGDLLPNLDAKKVLVPRSDRKLPRTDPADLRKKWDDQRKAMSKGTILKWKVIGPFMTKTPGVMRVDTTTPLEEEFLRRPDGTVDLAAKYKDHGKTLQWFPTQAGKLDGQVDGDKVFGHHEFCLVYGYACVQSDRDKDVVLKMGSDDGIKVWLNGKQVHRMEAMRGYSLDSDTANVQLKKGANHVVVKLSQLAGGWGFGVCVVQP